MSTFPAQQQQQQYGAPSDPMSAYNAVANVEPYDWTAILAAAGGDRVEDRVEVARGEVVGVGPVDQAARPLDRALARAVDARRPDAS